MRRRAVTISWNKSLLRLYLIGDTHVGNDVCDERRIERLAQIIKEDEDALVVGLGDFIEAIALSDTRFDPREAAAIVPPEHLNNIFYYEACRFCQLMEPTRGKWAMLIPGNHESLAARQYHTDAAMIIADRIGCAYQGQGDEAGWLRIQMKGGEVARVRDTVEIFCAHGWGGGDTLGTPKYERLVARKRARIVVVGHGHKPFSFPYTVEGLDRQGWEETTQGWFVECFPMVDKHGYISRKGGNAPPMGYAVVSIERINDATRLGAELKEL